ncbi:MAG: aminotransferase class V-fold PLP-dependent enzyme [Erythrobacter sp.]
MQGFASLFPDHDQMQSIEEALSQKLLEVRQSSSARRTTPGELSSEWLATLNEKTFEETEDLTATMDWVIEALKTGIVQMTHPGHLGLFNPSPNFPSECADRIVSAFNPQICVYSHAPAAVEIERHTISAIARRAGMPSDSEGHFTSGGAEANATAVLCAMQARFPEYGDDGIWGLTSQPVIYVSAESHLAWLKIAHAAGIGRRSVRLVATDGKGCMDVASLKATLEDDLQNGLTPVMIAATAGTTNAGMVDPIAECRALADQYGIWLHVDAAWGGALIASSKLSTALSGLERADSVTIDAHKWFAATMGAGIFLTSRTGILAEVFRVSASYMPDSDASRDYYINSMQWSRRFIGLRMFLALSSAGWDGFAEHVERSVRLSKRLAARLTAKGWRHVNDSLMGVVCLVPPGGSSDVDRYVHSVHQAGRFWVSKAQFEGQTVLRACVTNGRTDESTIDGLNLFLASV